MCHIRTESRFQLVGACAMRIADLAHDKAFTVDGGDGTQTFDCFECAIHALAPVCDHCGCKVVGHGVEASGAFFCCASCARMAGEKGLRDRVA